MNVDQARQSTLLFPHRSTAGERSRGSSAPPFPDAFCRAALRGRRLEEPRPPGPAVARRNATVSPPHRRPACQPRLRPTYTSSRPPSGERRPRPGVWQFVHGCALFPPPWFSRSRPGPGNPSWFPVSRPLFRQPSLGFLAAAPGFPWPPWFPLAALGFPVAGLGFPLAGPGPWPAGFPCPGLPGVVAECDGVRVVAVHGGAAPRAGTAVVPAVPSSGDWPPFRLSPSALVLLALILRPRPTRFVRRPDHPAAKCLQRQRLPV